MATQKMHVRKNDTVIVISGKDKGKKGKILIAIPDDNKVVVEGVNIVAKHKKPRSNDQQGGIIHQEAPINASKVMLYCSKCQKPSRRAYKILDDGTKSRICKHCGDTFDK